MASRARAYFKGDFMGFTFGDKHSSDIGIVRTSDGSRYNSELLPSFNDVTVAVPGGDGTYYFGSYYQQKTFSVPFATDELTESEFRELKRWFGDKGIHQLIFDEAPYKAYSAKIAAVPNFNYICFDEIAPMERSVGVQRIYKGEGTIQFVCYYPFARSIWKGLNQVTGDAAETIEEWAAASGLPETEPLVSGTTISLKNPGDVETDINIITSATSNLSFSLNGSVKLQLNNITLKNGDSKIRINSSTHLIEGLDSNNNLTGNLYNKYISSGDFFKVPLGNSTLTGPSMTVEYDYLYY